VQYCLARAIVDQQIVLSQFEDDAYLEARVVAMLPRVEAAPHPQVSAESDARFRAEVSVTTTDGRELRKTVAGAAGRLTENPVSPSRLRAKYRDCAGRALSAAGVDRSLELLAGLDSLERVATLTDVLAAELRSAPTALALAV
jgi:2-methylcitrate dehydratase PrpD